MGAVMIKFIYLALLLTVSGSHVFAHEKGSTPDVTYAIRVDAADLTGLSVEMRITGGRGTLRVAMAAHPEYDDRYWRYIENFSAVDVRGQKLNVAKDEDAVWRIENAARDTYVRYRLRLPPAASSQRDAWKPFLTASGGMVGDLHSLMYVVGETSRPARLTLVMPDGWKAATGLEPTHDPRTFIGSTELMLDAPVMIGNLTESTFQAGGVPHKVVFWSELGGPAFDANAIVNGIRKLADETIKAFGKPPYPRYVFLFQNGGQAALEHLTSVNIGLSLRLEDLFQEVAHEYIHVWNLMDVRPRERVGVRYRFAEPTGVLWWNEGATIMFADLLIRRAGLPGESRTRIKRLESAIARYMTSPGYYTLSAEQVSRGDSHPFLLGDNSASPHLQGEVLSTMLDFKIRDATDGRRDVTDVMRKLSDRFDFQHGIVNSDIEKTIAQVCGCEIREFFREYIYNAKRMDFDHYLGLIGMRADIGSTPAVDRDGKPAADLRIGPLSFDGPFKIRITNPQSVWAKAGLHTGDTLLSIDGAPVATWSDLRGWMRKAKIGDVARAVTVRDGVTRTIEVPITGYDIATVSLIELPAPTPKQLRLRNAWNSAN